MEENRIICKVAGWFIAFPNAACIPLRGGGGWGWEWDCFPSACDNPSEDVFAPALHLREDHVTHYSNGPGKETPRGGRAENCNHFPNWTEVKDAELQGPGAIWSSQQQNCAHRKGQRWQLTWGLLQNRRATKCWTFPRFKIRNAALRKTAMGKESLRETIVNQWRVLDDVYFVALISVALKAGEPRCDAVLTCWVFFC